MRLPPSEPQGEGGPDLHYFSVGHDTFALGETLEQKTTDKQRENIKYRISGGRRVVENALSRFRILLETMEQRPNTVRDIVLTC